MNDTTNKSITKTASKKFVIALSGGFYLSHTSQGAGFTQDIKACSRFFTRKAANHALKTASEIVNLDDAEIIDTQSSVEVNHG
jgi:hypothetical protein